MYIEVIFTHKLLIKAVELNTSRLTELLIITVELYLLKLRNYTTKFWGE